MLPRTKTTAEDVKAILEAYRLDNHPEGRWASAMFDTGREHAETLVVVSTDCPHSPSAELPSPSLSVPEHSSFAPTA